MKQSASGTSVAGAACINVVSIIVRLTVIMMNLESFQKPICLLILSSFIIHSLLTIAVPSSLGLH